MKTRIQNTMMIIGVLSSISPLFAATAIIDSGDFIIDNRHTLVTSSSSGGSVTAPGEGSYLYAGDVSVSIVATRQTNYHFVNWTGTAVTAGKVANVTSANTTVTMNGDYTLVASFALDSHTLAHDWNGDGILSIIGDVPGFVNCVYFENCPDGINPIDVGDCNKDGIISIIGDVPCFVECVYFGNCPE